MFIKILLEKNVSASKLCDIIKIYPQVLVNAKVASDKKDAYANDDEITVSYTHLDVYKRQHQQMPMYLIIQ